MQRPLFHARRFLAVIVLVLGVSASGRAEVNFSREILPVLSDRCFQCHGPDAKNRKGKLRLDVEADAKATGENGAAIVEGKPDASLVMARITSPDPDEVMPPVELHRELSRDQIALIRQWIAEGALWGRHWAYEKPVRPETNADFQCRSAIDALVLEKLTKTDLKLSRPARRRSLARRLSLDLRGLPLTPDELDRFVSDQSPEAAERLVDRFLADPAFGERMSWEWLDAARYADSNGYQGDNDRTMWPWRDWVVDAFNRNMPWDEFTVWQLAGDLLPDAKPEQVLATAFLRNHMINGEGGRIPEENRVDYVMDMTETTGTIWLGLTLNCCRCHDHKFDPVTQREYYRMSAFFNQTPVDGSGGDPRTPPNMRVPSKDQAARIARLQRMWERATDRLEDFETRIDKARFKDKAAEVLRKPVRDRGTGDLREVIKQSENAGTTGEYHGLLVQAKEIRSRLDEIERRVPVVMVMGERDKPRDTFVLDRGLYTEHRDKVEPGVPASLPPMDSSKNVNRLDLAHWLVSTEQPLTARVTVNRFWQQLFGIGLVKTTEDFGVQAEFPLQLALLDWLSVEFVETGWDTKKLFRQIVLSETYGLSSEAPPEAFAMDPENRYLARGARFRLSAATIRDQALAAGGLLVRQIGGEPVKPYQPDGVWGDVTFGKKRYSRSTGAGLYRRSVYTFWRRIIAPTTMFDSGSRQVCQVKAVRTNSPLHALGTLNDVTYVEAARGLAYNALSQCHDPKNSIQCAAKRLLARSLDEGELDELATVYQKWRSHFAQDAEATKSFLNENGDWNPDIDDARSIDLAALTVVCLSLLNLDECLTRE